MELFKFLQSITSELLFLYDHDAAQVIAFDILQAATKKNRAQLLVEKNREITKEEKKNVRLILERHLQKHEPLAYIFGTMPFLDLMFIVRPPVLIPRPETEEWTHKVIAQLKKLSPKEQKELTILDLCTGSGCIGISLAHAFPFAQVDAVDKADHAILLAKENAQKNGIKNIQFFLGDLFQPLPTDKKYDLIVANPPYIDGQAWESIEPSVKNWEDYDALVAQDHGMYLVKKIITEASKNLKKHSSLDTYGIKRVWIEIGHDQGPESLDFCKKSGYSNAKIAQDYMHVNRLILGTPDIM